MDLMRYYSDIIEKYPTYVTQTELCEICKICAKTAYNLDKEEKSPTQLSKTA